MSNAGFNRRNFFIGSALGIVAGAAGSQLLQRDSTCPGEALPDDAPDSRRALHQLIATLGDYDRDYLQRGLMPPTRRDIAEGEKYLTHLLRVGCELFLEHDVDHPFFAQIVTPTLKLMGDNADAIYFHSQIRGDKRYRIRGKRTGEVYISITVHTGSEPGGWAKGVAGALNDRQFRLDADGNFEILIGPDVEGPNSLRTSADAVSVITRHYYMNETYAAADPDVHPRIRIDAVEPAPPPPAPEDADMARRLRAVNQFVRANSLDRPLMNPLSTPDWFSLVPNSLGKPALWTPEEGGGGWGAVDNAYAAGRFELKPDEALIIEGVLPKCAYASVLLWNRYLQSFDFRYRQVSLNRNQMQFDADGSFRIVVAHQNPGVRNWLDTEGRDNGIMFWRFLLPEGEFSEMRTRKVAFSELAQKT